MRILWKGGPYGKNVEDPGLKIVQSIAFGIGKPLFKLVEIKNLTIPITLNSVWLGDKSAFEFVSGIEKITFTPGNTGYGFNYSADEDSNCWYQKTPWYLCGSTLKEIVFEDGIQRIGSNAFRELNISSLTIPDSVQTLGEHSFYRCEKLVDLTIPITLDTVCSDTQPAFDQCNSIQNLRLTAGKTGIGWDYREDHSPIWCTSGCWLAKLFVDAGITHIGTNTFSEYTFYSPSGSTLLPTADNLSGYTYIGSAGNLKMDRQTEGDSGATIISSVLADGCSAIDIDPVPIAMWIRKVTE